MTEHQQPTIGNSTMNAPSHTLDGLAQYCLSAWIHRVARRR
jgi:hypothetical protein